MTKLFLIFFAAMTTLIGAAWAQTNNNPSGAKLSQTKPLVVEKSPVKCRVEAYGRGAANENDKTSIVRARPDKNSAIVKTVFSKDELVFSISGGDGRGWFEISKIEAVGDEEKTLFKGRGWVHSSLLDTSVAAGDPNLRAAPNAKSRVIKKLIADESEARPIACRGDWMQIKSGDRTGWLSRAGQCANPLTTCP